MQSMEPKFSLKLAALYISAAVTEGAATYDILTKHNSVEMRTNSTP